MYKLKQISLSLIIITSLNVYSAEESVSFKTYNELTRIQILIDKGNGDEAYQRLQTLLTKVNDDSLDQALTLQTLGYLAMADENLEEAINYLTASLSLNKMPPNVTCNINYLIAQLYSALGKFYESLSFAESWFSEIDSPTPSQYIFMASIYAQTNHHLESIAYAEVALSLTSEPKESWYQLLTSSYFAMERFSDVERILCIMVEYWPSEARYWEQLASVYIISGNESSALAVLQIAFSENIIDKETTITSLIHLAAIKEIPEQAARLLELGFAKNILPENEVYLNMLAAMLTAAKERKAAIGAYERLADLSKKGDELVAISSIYLEQGDWKNAEINLLKALDRELESPGKAWLLLGITQTEQQNFEEAKKSLRKSVSFSETERLATQWINHIDVLIGQTKRLAQNQH